MEFIVERLVKKMSYLIRTRTRLCLYKTGNSFLIVDKQTDREKTYEQFERRSFLQIDYDPTTLHINKVKEWVTKWISRSEIVQNGLNILSMKMLY